MDDKDVEYDFLQSLINNKTDVSVFLINGIKLEGKIVNNDQYVILLENDREQLVFKNAISTILPRGRK